MGVGTKERTFLIGIEKNVLISYSFKLNHQKKYKEKGLVYIDKYSIKQSRHFVFDGVKFFWYIDTIVAQVSDIAPEPLNSFHTQIFKYKLSILIN